MEVLTTLYGLFRWSGSRTTVTLADDRITVGSPFSTKEVRGASIAGVREMPNGRSPNHLLLTDDGRKLHVPSIGSRKVRMMPDSKPRSEEPTALTRRHKRCAVVPAADPLCSHVSPSHVIGPPAIGSHTAIPLRSTGA